jgi:hypothetical protein
MDRAFKGVTPVRLIPGWRYCLSLFAVAMVVGFTGSQWAVAQTAAVVDLGSQTALEKAGQWPDWSFTTDLDLGRSGWRSVNVVNTGCFSGPDDPSAGTATAGAIAWYARLLPAPGPSGLLVLAGTLNPIEGTTTTGSVTVIPAHDTAPPPFTRAADTLTHINVQIRNLDEFARGNDFKVCLTGS